VRRRLHRGACGAVTGKWVLGYCLGCMKRNDSTAGRASDPIIDMAGTVARGLAERSHFTKDLLTQLSHWLAENEAIQRKFRYMVLFRLCKLEAIVAHALNFQLARNPPPGRGSDQERVKFAQEVEERVSEMSNDLYHEMTRFILGQTDEPGRRRDGRRKWSDWEI